MSRIGRMPIAIPAGVTVEVAENNKVTVKGPKGTLERVLPAEMEIKVENGEITVTRPNDLKKMKSLHGLTRTLINNMVVGVTAGYEKKLEVNGVGYRAAKAGNKLTLSLGYSHPVEMIDPEGVETCLLDSGHVGAGLGKAVEIPEAIRKGKEDAIKNLVNIALDENKSITHDFIGNYGSSSVLLKRAPEGTGIIAGGPARIVCELAGIKNIRTKSLGSNNKQNVVLSTIAGLSQLKTPEQVAANRGKSIDEIMA